MIAGMCECFRWNAKNESWDVTAALRPMIVNLDFQKSGRTVYKAVQYAGYVGIITGMKPVNWVACRCFLLLVLCYSIVCCSASAHCFFFRFV